MRIVTVVGTRPQLIKAAPVSRRLEGSHVKEQILHTGQHYDAGLSGDLIEELDLPHPAYQLAIGSGPHGRQTGRMLEAIEGVLAADPPDLLLTYGDTNSTLAGALAAAKLGVPVAHVEAGVRSFDRAMPEEINRVLTDRVTSLALAPTQTARRNLLNEGVEAERICVVGDPMLDAFLHFREGHVREGHLRNGLDDILPSGPFILATVHRQENADDSTRLAAIFDGLVEIAQQTPIVVPLHPRTRAALKREGRLRDLDRHLRLMPPTSYLTMLALEQAAQLIVTDSGGVQREAFFAKVPCVVLRNSTEWPELVTLGWSRLVDPGDSTRVVDAVRSALGTRPVDGTTAGADTHPLGRGDSSERITVELERFLDRLTAN